MKKLSLLLALVLLLTSLSVSGLADNKFLGCQCNEATFETLEEAHLNGPDATKQLDNQTGIAMFDGPARAMAPHPALDNYPEGTAFVYRSANLYGGRAAARLNTNLVVYAEQHFDDKDAAFAYLKDLGVIDIIDEAIGSVILVTPANGTSFGQEDQQNYYKLQSAIFSQKAGGTDKDGNRVVYADGEYFGCWCYYYVIGIDGGATFLNNYVASTYDFVTRIAGMLLVNGKMDYVRNVAGTVPVYFAGGSQDTVQKYVDANKADAYFATPDQEVFYNQNLPLQKVIVDSSERTAAEYIKDAYFNLFIKAMRAPVVTPGLYSASTPYQGWGSDQAPYALCERNAILGNRTADGIVLARVEDDETFADLKMHNGKFLNMWYEYLPEEALNGTAAEHSIPLILANHGGGDDARVFVDEIGLLALAGRERIAIVAPDETDIWQETVDGKSVNGVCCEALPALAEYMLKTYPALDPSRVYTMGYSMGGGATLKALNGKPSLFASGACMAASSYVATEEQAKAYETVDLPIMLTTSAFDFVLVNTFVSDARHIATGFEKQIRVFCGHNGITPKFEEFDYDRYPIIGIQADGYRRTLVGGEHINHTWYLNNDDGVPMIAVNVTEDLAHALYPEYANVVWDYFKHFSRNPDTLEVIYNPYVD